jgi:hypothetical protein
MELIAELIGDFVDWIIVVACVATMGFILMMFLG